MARIQILELPDEETADGRTVTPFALIVDGYDGPTGEHVANGFSEFRNLCGARAILVTEEIIDIPGLTPEELAAYGPRHDIGTATVKVEPDLSGFESAITAAIERAQNAIVEAVTPPKITMTPEFTAHRARRTEEFLASGRTDGDGRG